MGLLDSLMGEKMANALRQYVSDAMPGGLLNPEAATIPARVNRGANELANELRAYGATNKAALDNPSWDNVKAAVGANMAAAGMAPMGIVRPEVAKTLAIQKSIPDDEIFRAAVANTKGAEITDDGLKMMLARSQQANQSGMPSVRGGVFYLPEGAAQMKHYSTGKNGYGGSEKVAGETLITNPLFAKGGTGGKAPESAFDSLMGKGSYQSMRNDALKAYGGYGANASSRVEGIKSFLEKYAPELIDKAEYISRNSTQGNQLAYALQEAAVASAVRNAGHDAVLGYSKGKSGPFLSEVFDVREMNYPDKFGGSTVWPSLLGSQ